jgi:hypothetical protein
MLKNGCRQQHQHLMLIPSVGVWKVGKDFYFDRKFHDGVLAYTAYWPGSFRLAIRLSKSKPPQFGLIKFNGNKFPAKVTVLGSDETINSSHLEGVDIVLASGDSFDSFHLAGVKSAALNAYGIEYPRTRLRISAIMMQMSGAS